MKIAEIIQKYREVLIQIATPCSTGTGFYLSEFDLIVTNEHVVRDNQKVVIKGDGIEKQMVDVIYLDVRYDLAFLSAPREKLPKVPLASPTDLQEGDSVLAIGHPFGLKLSTTNGIVSNTQQEEGGLDFIQHDAALNPGNSGGPLVDESGKITGVNTFIIRHGNSIGFSLPVRYLVDAISLFQQGGGAKGARCSSCENIAFEDADIGKYCPHCGTTIQYPSQIKLYEAIGINHTIEQILSSLGYNIELSRIGPHLWQVDRGSASINFTYHEESGLIIGDAYLAHLPRKDIGPVYQYLLMENYLLNHLTFSIKDNEIILSLIIYDRYLKVGTGTEMIKYLCDKADHYDDILVRQYGAKWRDKNLN